MALPQIIFNKTQGLGRPLLGEDHISGLLFYSATLPTGFAADDRIKQVFSLAEAEALGIAEGSTFAVLWYHVREYFRIQPQGQLYIGVYAIPSPSYTFAEVATMQQFAEGKIRQIGILTPIAGVVSANITTLHNVCAGLLADHMPLSALLAFDISGVSDLSALPDLRTGNSAYYVSVIIGQDGAARGKALYDSESASITCLGAVLGAVSLASVHENIGWVKKFNLADTELDVAAFGNGELVRDKTTSFLEALHNKGYIFLRKHTGIVGTYLNDSCTAIAITSDFAYIENVRTIDKAIRNVRALLLPELNGPVEVDAQTGKLAVDYVEFLKALGDQALNQMEVDGELSGFQTIINPDQNVLATSTVEVTIEKVPVGVSRKFTVNIGFTTQLS